MTGRDPTDQALAVIASIFERPAKPETADGQSETQPVDEASPGSAADAQPHDAEAELPVESGAAEAAAVPEPKVEDIDGHTRLGPGPLDALRFRWTIRRVADDRYHVEETIGDTALPIVSGPMDRDAALAFVDAREQDAIRRFETLRNEIVSGPSERGYEDDDGS